MNKYYIVFEGIDGSGKTTICSKIAESLIRQGYNVLLISEPSHSQIGLLLRNQMKNVNINQNSLALLYAADSYDIQEKIGNNYDFIISDRNYLSTVAYQMIYVDKEWLLMLHKFLKRPDVIFYLNISVEEAIVRIRSRKGDVDFFENYEALTRIKSNYEELVLSELDIPVYNIETSGKDKEEVEQNVMNIIQGQLSL